MPRWVTFILIFVGGIVAAFVLPFLSWAIADEGFAATSEAEFCVSCHSMELFEASYAADIHGGKNAHGVQAECTDCHLTHTSSTAYFINKVQTGTHDWWVETFGDVENIDWEAKRAHREDYVYDSGCLHCHNNLEQATQASNKAFVAHHDYFAGTIDNQCVTCHEHVGHSNLGLYISANSGEDQ
jgi:cytochrome c-type protein NapC